MHGLAVRYLNYVTIKKKLHKGSYDPYKYHNDLPNSIWKSVSLKYRWLSTYHQTFNKLFVVTQSQQRHDLLTSIFNTLFKTSIVYLIHIYTYLRVWRKKENVILKFFYWDQLEDKQKVINIWSQSLQLKHYKIEKTEYWS